MTGRNLAGSSNAGPAPGTTVALPLDPQGDDLEDLALVRLLAVPRRDLTRAGALAAPLLPFADALLVEVSMAGRVVIPGAWAEPSILQQGRPAPRTQVVPDDLRLPAVVAGEGSAAQLHWGETVWPLPFDDTVAIPTVCRASIHSAARLRRLALVAAGRRQDVALTLWRDPGFEVPWHDVRLVPHARWWFEMADVPPTATYRDALRLHGIG